jgi:UDP-glucose 4-epimerase
MKWLITGGCGFIGRNLIRHLVTNDEQHSIRVLDNLSVGTRADLERVAPSYEELSLKGKEIEESPEDGGVQLVEGDVLDAEGARKAATGIDVIVHLAANTGVAPSVEDPRHDCETNVIGTLNMLEAARHQDVSRFVLASSGAPIGECEPPIHEEMAPHPKSPYGASKLAGEGYCSAYYGSFDVETVALRFGNVYGPLSSHKSSVVAKFIRRARDGKVLEIYGDGHQTRDYIFTEDLVRAIRLAATTSGVGGELFQIATNSETSVNELVDALVPVLREAGIEDVEVTNTEPRVGDVRRNYSDTSKAQSMLGWEAQVDLTEGLRRTVQDLVPSAEVETGEAVRR